MWKVKEPSYVPCLCDDTHNFYDPRRLLGGTSSGGCGDPFCFKVEREIVDYEDAGGFEICFFNGNTEGPLAQRAQEVANCLPIPDVLCNENGAELCNSPQPDFCTGGARGGCGLVVNRPPAVPVSADGLICIDQEGGCAIKWSANLGGYGLALPLTADQGASDIEIWSKHRLHFLSF